MPAAAKGSSYVKVFVRLRPTDTVRGAGQSGGGELAYTLEGGKSITVRAMAPAKEKEGEEEGGGGGNVASPAAAEKGPLAGARDADLTYAFHRIFDVDTDQDMVYREVASNMVQHAFRGYNSSCFAYGQTGSGKTFTMYGPEGGNAVRCPPHLQGLIPRAASALFAEATARSPFADASVTASLCEIYCDKIRDLGKAFLEGFSPSQKQTSALAANAAAQRHGVMAATDPRGLPARYAAENLELHEDAKGQVYVKGLSRIPVSTPAEVMAIIEVGFHLRATHETRMNATSSRSHTVFTLHVAQHDRGTGQSTASALHFIDLAGSERLQRSESTGQRMAEAQSINLSLTCLGKVVGSLGSGPDTHIPYRDSKLTRMLQNALGGSSYTSLVATVHPRAVDHDETLSTLAFALRCQSVVNRPRINFVAPGAEDVAARLRSLEAECAVLRYRAVRERLTGSLRAIKMMADAGLAGALGPDGRFTVHPHGMTIGMTVDDATGHPFVRRALALLVMEPTEEDEEVYETIQDARAKILTAIAAAAAEGAQGSGAATPRGGGSRPGSARAGGGTPERPSSASSTSIPRSRANSSAGGGGGGGGGTIVPAGLAYAGAPLTDDTMDMALAAAIGSMSTAPGGALSPSVAGLGAGGGFSVGTGGQFSRPGSAQTSRNPPSSRPGSARPPVPTLPPPAAVAAAQPPPPPPPPPPSAPLAVPRRCLLSPPRQAAAAEPLALGGDGGGAFTAGGGVAVVHAMPVPGSHFTVFGAAGADGGAGGGAGGVGGAGIRVSQTNLPAAVAAQVSRRPQPQHRPPFPRVAPRSRSLPRAHTHTHLARPAQQQQQLSPSRNGGIAPLSSALFGSSAEVEDLEVSSPPFSLVLPTIPLPHTCPPPPPPPTPSAAPKRQPAQSYRRAAPGGGRPPRAARRRAAKGRRGAAQRARRRAGGTRCGF
jgi:hypothetical protein